MWRNKKLHCKSWSNRKLSSLKQLCLHQTSYEDTQVLPSSALILLSLVFISQLLWDFLQKRSVWLKKRGGGGVSFFFTLISQPLTDTDRPPELVLLQLWEILQSDRFYFNLLKAASFSSFLPQLNATRVSQNLMYQQRIWNPLIFIFLTDVRVWGRDVKQAAVLKDGEQLVVLI